ncbi:MAG: hypothetical protein ACKVWV_19015, partial [Planctomycetota bacterium]
AFTIVFVQRDSFACARFARGAQLVSLERCPRPVNRSVAEVVEAGALPGGRIRGPVWVLLDDVYVHTLALAARTVRGLGDDEIEQALGYEAQMLSGFSATEAALAWRALPSSPMSDGERWFWVAQTPRAERDELERALRAQGARLLGLAHAGGLPARLGTRTRDDGTWKRLEVWPDVTAEIESTAEDVIHVRIQRADPTRRRRDGAGTLPETEQLVAHAHAAPPSLDEDVALFALDDESALSTFLCAWASVLATDPRSVPVLRAPARPVAMRTIVAGAIASTLFAAGACFWHYSTLARERADAQSELALVTRPTAQRSEAIAERTKLESERTALAHERETLEASVAACAWTADFPARALGALASARPAGLAVEEIELAWRGSRVRGVCTEPGLVDRLSSSVAHELADHGCVVAPRSKRLRDDGSGVYEFEIEILPAPVATSAPRAAEAAR